MLLSDIYYDLNAFNNQDGTDDYIGIDDFNRRIMQEQIDLIIDVIDEEKGRGTTHRPMTDFMVAAATQSATGSEYFWQVPSDLMRVETIVYIPVAGIKIPVEYIQSDEVVRRFDDLLSPPMEENPVCYMEQYTSSRYLKTLPLEANGSYGLFYIKKPTTPFLDYYTDTSLEMIFLTAGQSLLPITTGTYRDGTVMSTKTGTSATVELDIPVEFHQRFVERLIEKLGLKDRDNLQLSYGVAKEQQSENKNIIR